MAKNVHGFQVRTPICHIVPVLRAYGGGVVGENKIWSQPQNEENLARLETSSKNCWVSASASGALREVCG